MNTQSNCGVAIVGGGCSGLLVAVQLLRNGFRGRVTIIEPRERLGAGLAYSTPFEQHLLNVPAGKMSALAGEPGHFLDWLRAGRWPEVDSKSFAPRKWYGEYLLALLHQTLGAHEHSSFSHVRAEVLGITTDTEAVGARLALSDGTAVEAERVVLALGNPASCPDPGTSRQGIERRWHLSPWFGDALRVRFAGERILVLGTGLTAVDSVLALQCQDIACQIVMLSRRGILPQVHDMRVSAGAPPRFQNAGNVRLMFQELRVDLEAARQAGHCWRAVVDGLRPISNSVWQELTLTERARFMRHLKAWWEPYRHRMAPEIRARLDEYRARGTVEIVAGRVREVRPHGDSLAVHVLPKRGGSERVFDVDRIISCTGVQENYHKGPRHLILSLLQSGLARSNDLGTGFRTDGRGALLDAEAKPSSIFFTLGPPRRGELLETTAVPEIRTQAEELGRYLAGLSVRQ